VLGVNDGMSDLGISPVSTSKTGTTGGLGVLGWIPWVLGVLLLILTIAVTRLLLTRRAIAADRARSEAMLTGGERPSLQRAPTPVVASAAPAPATPMTTAPIAATPQPPAPPAPPTAEVQARATGNARQALEAMRPEFLRRCWTPAVAISPEPARLPLIFQMSFSPEGKLVVLGISDDPKISRVDVSTCLLSIPLPLKIPAPGRSLQLEVPFTLP